MIITPDGTLRYAAGAVVDTVTTDETGLAESKPLYLGKYEVKEITAPTGYVLNTEIHTAELVYAGQEVDDPHVPSLFDKDPVHWQTGRDQSDFLIRLAAIKRDPIFAEGSYTLTALPHDVLLAVYEQNGRRVAGLFSLRGASALVRFPAPNGVYHDSITGRPVEIYENQLATDGQPLILEL